MDELLQQAYSRGSRPFDGLTLRPADLLPLTKLAQLLAVTVDFLRNAFPSAALLRHADWHEHDGYVTSSVASNWSEVSTIVASPESLYANRPRDDFVRIGIYEPSGSFYLRIWVPDADEDPNQYAGRWGSFDLSASNQVVSGLAAALAPVRLEVEHPKLYFEARSAA